MKKKKIRPKKDSIILISLLAFILRAFSKVSKSLYPNAFKNRHFSVITNLRRVEFSLI